MSIFSKKSKDEIKAEAAEKQAHYRARAEALKAEGRAVKEARQEARAERKRDREGLKAYRDQRARVVHNERGALVASWGSYRLYENGFIEKWFGKDQGRVSLADVEVLEFDQGSEFEKRVTGARVLAVGLLAPLIKKKSGGEFWFIVSGGGFDWVEEVPKKDVPRAMKFYQKVKQSQRTAV